MRWRGFRAARQAIGTISSLPKRRKRLAELLAVVSKAEARRAESAPCAMMAGFDCLFTRALLARGLFGARAGIIVSMHACGASSQPTELDLLTEPDPRLAGAGSPPVGGPQPDGMDVPELLKRAQDMLVSPTSPPKAVSKAKQHDVGELACASTL